MVRISVLAVVPMALALLPAGARAQAPVSEQLRQRTEFLLEGQALEIGGMEVPAGTLVPELYADNGFAPIWTPATATQLVNAVVASAAHGLDPRHYGLDALRALPDRPSDASAQADAEILRSYALTRLASDLRYGRVDPETVDKNVEVPRAADDLSAGQLLAIARGDVAGGLNALAPTHFVYRGLLASLARYRAIQQQGGWPPLPEGPVLAVDSSGPRVALLRRRLAIEGDLPAGTDTISEVFDSAVARGVQSFQHRHGLNEDGIVGPGTLTEMNVPVETRIDMLRINLDRGRYLLHGLSDTFVAVNIAGQQVYVVRGGEVVWETRSVVGKEYHETPIFVDSMRYIVINPTWTVPRSINGEILAHVRRDPGYLRRQNMSILDGSGGVVSPSSIDFSQYSNRSFPYTFRQGPGEGNALGRVKFMFPNKHNVYLHDTPSRSLFEREIRTFSHGCIRVQNPLMLAQVLLNDPVKWSMERIEAAVATGETQTVRLTTPIPTLLLYWTASTDLHGETHFFSDVYDRDAAYLRALDGP